MMAGSVCERHVVRGAAVVGLAHDLEVGLPLQDCPHADADEGVVIDEQDPDPLTFAAPVGATPPAVRPGIGHALSPLSRTGTSRTTTVPFAGRERTVNSARTSSARSRMNWSPKVRRPGAA